MPKKKLIELCEIHKGKEAKAEIGSVPVYSIGGTAGYTDCSICNEPCIAIGSIGTIGKPRLFYPPCWITGTQIYLTAKEGVDIAYIYAVLDCIDFKQFEQTFSIRGGIDSFKFENYPVEFYPLNQQTAIGEKYLYVKEQMQKELEAIERLKRYKKVMLDGMFAKGEPQKFAPAKTEKKSADADIKSGQMEFLFDL